MPDTDQPTVTREQRDAIREWLLWDLRGTCDDFGVYLTDREDYAGARESLTELTDGAALLDDLGWPEDDRRETFELTLSAEQLERMLDRFKEYAKMTFFGHALGLWKGMDEDREFDRALKIARAYIRLR